MKKLTASVLFIGLQAPPLPAHDAGAVQAVAAPAGECEESVTVFQDVSMIGRKDRLAANITRKHGEMNREGWRFVDMEIYIENADIEGAFLTYSRPAPCPAGNTRPRG